MVEGLYDVNWSKLSHALGDAVDVPELILSLASSDEGDRSQAFSLLYNSLWNQGAVYEATAYAVPFFIQLLDFPNFSDKARVMIFLAHLATGNAHLEVLREAGVEIDEASPEFQVRLAMERNWVRVTRKAVRKGLSMYLSLLRDADPKNRAAAAYLLACFHVEHRKIVPHLVRRLSIEKNPQAYASVVLSLGMMDIGNPGHRRILEQIRKGKHSPLVKMSATMALARHLREETPDDALTALLDFIATPDQYLPDMYHQLPWADSHLVGDLSLVLCYFGHARAHLIIPDLLRVLDHCQDSYSAVNITYALLYLGFDTAGGKVSARAETHIQHLILTAIAANEVLWKSNLETSELLRMFELPDWPDAIYEYLERVARGSED